MNQFFKSLPDHYKSKFGEAYGMLNEKQKEAVDHIEGCVMTVAGPGTGKTQLLAIRIGQILKETDAGPHNILCMTFTDAGSVAMRNRLLQFIGPEAYNVNIFTYHSFCNQVIRDNIDYFGAFRDLQTISDIELVEIMRQIIDTLEEDNVLKRLKGNIYLDTYRLKSLFSTMKQEGWKHEDIAKAIGDLPAYLAEQEEYIYKRKYTDKKTGKVYLAGDVNEKKIATKVARYDKLLAASKKLTDYDNFLEQRERFDYNDMILWVLEAFKNYPDLLAGYQERYQYILVDEYQDTNGSQNELIFQLASYWDDPNLFVVGDDDQSIFRFQGANMNNITEFRAKFDPTIIVLNENYRSFQGILDKSKKLIDINIERLPFEKKLIESRQVNKGKGEHPKFIKYQNYAQEESGIINQILKLKDEGVPLNQMAIIYRKHNNVDNLVKYFLLKGIPLNIKKRFNVLVQPDVKRLLNLMRYLHEEYTRMHSGEYRIFEILHYDFFDIPARDVGLISLFSSRKTDEITDDKRWRDIIASESLLEAAGAKNVEKIIKLSSLLERWIKDIPNLTIQVLFEKILTQSGILDRILRSEDKTWKMQVINTFFDFMKTETSKNPKIGLKEILHMVSLMEDDNIPLPLNKVIFAEEGVHFLSAHGSKGLEFQHVFIIRANSKEWEPRVNNSTYSFPPTIIPLSKQSDIEDDRRLFYVAMTRAKDSVTVTYPLLNEDGKELEGTRFIYEIVDDPESDIIQGELSDEIVTEYKMELMRYHQGEAQLIDHNLIDRVLESFKISATSLNKYLRCPLAFYFENILRVPLARNATMGYGSAVHFALERYFKELEDRPDRSLPEKDFLLVSFKKGMAKYRSHFTDSEAERYTKNGVQVLDAYYDHYHQQWLLPKQHILEYKINLTHYNEVPISGILDKIMVFDSYVDVIDYKTGSYRNASSKLKPPLGDEDKGGDYWRQIVFYDLLLTGDKSHSWSMRTGAMEFIEPEDDKFKRKEFTVEAFEREIVGKQLKETYDHIKAHHFEKGCGEKDCVWCTFVSENNPVALPSLGEDQEDIDLYKEVPVA